MKTLLIYSVLLTLEIFIPPHFCITSWVFKIKSFNKNVTIKMHYKLHGSVWGIVIFFLLLRIKVLNNRWKRSMSMFVYCQVGAHEDSAAYLGSTSPSWGPNTLFLPNSVSPTITHNTVVLGKWFYSEIMLILGFPGASLVKNPRAKKETRIWFLEKIPWRWKRQTTPAFLLGKFHRQRTLVGYSPWGCRRVRHDLVTKQQQDIQISPV